MFQNKIVHLLSVALALRAIAAAFLHVLLHFSLVPAFSCDLLCYPEWRKEQNLPYLSLVNALHEGEIIEMLWFKKKKKKPLACIFVLFLHLWGIGIFEGTLGKEKPRGKRVLEKQTWLGS